MKTLRPFQTILNRLFSTTGDHRNIAGRQAITALDWREDVQPVAIVDDWRGVIAPVQRRLFWERFASTATPATNNFQAMGFYSFDRPLRLEYFEIVAMNSNVLVGLINTTAFVPSSGFGTPVRPYEGRRGENVTRQVWSQETTGVHISGAQIEMPREIDWVRLTRPVIYPTQAWGAQTVAGSTEGDYLECIMAWSELDDDLPSFADVRNS